LLAATLVLALGFLMIIAPAMENRWFIQIGMYAPLLISIYVVSRSPRFVWVWGTATMLAALLGVFALVRDEPMLLMVDLGLRAALMAVLMSWLVREMLRDARVSLDTILGGICVYILIGFFYALLYLILLLADPGSLQSGGQAFDLSLRPGTHPLQTIPAMFYFSFTAFTTMGFGDITPVSALARYVTITEGMIGQLFPAVFIARLVSLNLVHSAGPPRGAG
jgi:hypothetical protein